MQQLIGTFIETANAFDVEGTLALFATDAIISDITVGDAFVGPEGVRQYLEQFFVGYKTTSKLLSLRKLDNFNVFARIDFTGDFGHEVGILKMKINAAGLIQRIDADLE